MSTSLMLTSALLFLPLPFSHPSPLYKSFLHSSLYAKCQRGTCGLGLTFCLVLFTPHIPPLLLPSNHWQEPRVCCLLLVKVPTHPIVSQVLVHFLVWVVVVKWVLPVYKNSYSTNYFAFFWANVMFFKN
jgi:hypothetical protein